MEGKFKFFIIDAVSGRRVPPKKMHARDANFNLCVLGISDSLP